MLSVAEDAEVVWYPQLGGPSSETNTTFQRWLVGIEERELIPGVWVELKAGKVTSIHEQWVP